jgi:hypothetical protein
MLQKRGKEQINAYNPNFSRLYYWGGSSVVGNVLWE